MARLVSDEEATGKVKEVFDEIRSKFGMVPNFSGPRPQPILAGWNLTGCVGKILWDLRGRWIARQKN